MSHINAGGRQILLERRGTAAIEFAFAAALMALLMLGTADLTFYVRSKLKLDTAASSLAQIVTQYNELYTNDFPTLFLAAQLAAGNVTVSGKFGATIISGVTNVAGTPAIAWQQISPSATSKSQFGVVGANPTLPGGYVLPVGATLIVTEVFTTATPWVFAASIMGGSDSGVVSSVALFEPRLAPLSSITAGNRP